MNPAAETSSAIGRRGRAVAEELSRRLNRRGCCEHRDLIARCEHHVSAGHDPRPAPLNRNQYDVTLDLVLIARILGHAVTMDTTIALSRRPYQ
jgi:hypothetical protein